MRGVRILILASASVAAMAAMWLMRGAIESRANVPVQIAAPQQETKPVVEAPQTVDVLVAARDVPIGRTLSGEDVKWQAFPVEAASDYFYLKGEDEDAMDIVIGSASRASMRAGEPLSTDKVIDINGSGVMASLLRKGMRAVAVPISDVTGAGGFILPGDYVDLLLTRQIAIEEFNPTTGEIDRTVTHNQTETVMETVRVLAIDQRLTEGNGENGATAVGNTATIELNPDQVELISLTRQIAKQERGFLTLSLRSFSELIEEYGEDVNKIMPKTILDLQALARAKIEQAREMKEIAETFRREQEAYELERRKREEEDERRLAQEERERLAAEAAEAKARKDAEILAAASAAAPPPPPEEDGIVLIRNGAAIVVRTTNPNTDQNAGGN